MRLGQVWVNFDQLDQTFPVRSSCSRITGRELAGELAPTGI